MRSTRSRRACSYWRRSSLARSSHSSRIRSSLRPFVRSSSKRRYALRSSVAHQCVADFLMLVELSRAQVFFQSWTQVLSRCGDVPKGVQAYWLHEELRYVANLVYSQPEVQDWSASFVNLMPCSLSPRISSSTYNVFTSTKMRFRCSGLVSRSLIRLN